MSRLALAFVVSAALWCLAAVAFAWIVVTLHEVLR